MEMSVDTAEREHLDKVRNRFTTTAESFSEFVLSRRAAEAELLATMATDGLELTPASLALDVACGPGTLSLQFALRFGRVVGLDFTPEMLRKARQAADRVDRGNLELVRGDAYALPFREESFDVAVSGYALHHLLDPKRVVRNIAAIVRTGGRVAIVDMVVPPGADGNAVNAIERARDASHATTLDSRALRGLLTGAGLRVLAEDTQERQRIFDDWMNVAGQAPGSPGYEVTKRLMRASAGADTAGYRPRRNEKSGAIEFVQTSMLLIAEKLR
jgi:ubiquinone/menaquinone biosynthesis C-methylase UbiE